MAWVWIGLILVGSVGAVMFALLRMHSKPSGAGSWLANHVLLVLHVGFIGLAQVIDVTTSSRTLSAVEEVLEFNAALVLVLYICQQARSFHLSRSAPHGR